MSERDPKNADQPPGRQGASGTSDAELTALDRHLDRGWQQLEAGDVAGAEKAA